MSFSEFLGGLRIDFILRIQHNTKAFLRFLRSVVASLDIVPDKIRISEKWIFVTTASGS